MRRHLINFAAASLTFTFGVTIYLYIYKQPKEILLPVEIKNTIEIPKAVSDTKLLQTVDEPSLLACEDKQLQPIWNELKNNLFYWSNEKPKTSCGDYFRILKTADLNADGEKEIIVARKEICAEGECDNISILQEEKDGKLKKIFGSIATAIDIKRSKTKSWLDLQLRFRFPQRGSYGIYLFKFDGEEYVLTNCWEEIHSVEDGKGKLHKLRKPKIIALEDCC